jgi:hypothetical protein
MYQKLEMWNHPENPYVEEENCYKVVGNWEEVYKLQHKAGK